MELTFKHLDEKLKTIKGSLAEKVCVAHVFGANTTAGKWQAPYRSWVIREITLYRAYDLLRSTTEDSLSSISRKLLIRASIETIAMLIYLNTITQKVIDCKLDYFEFEESTIRLTLGSKTIEKFPVPINVSSLIDKMNDKITNVSKIYDHLCEFAHPNYSGFIDSYSRANTEKFETTFGFFESTVDIQKDIILINSLIDFLIVEYNETWLTEYKRLLEWLEKNDKKLERHRNKLKRKNEDRYKH